jgi:hypothetical protein
MIASQCHAAAYLGRFTVVVDEDIDPTDMKDVIWAMTTRCDPVQDIEILRRCWSSPLDPILPKERKDQLQFAGYYRCLPAVRMDQGLSQVGDRAAGAGATGQKKVGEANLVVVLLVRAQCSQRGCARPASA